MWRAETDNSDMLELLNPNKSKRVMAGSVGAARRGPHLVAHGGRAALGQAPDKSPTTRQCRPGVGGGGGREINRHAVAKPQSVIAMTYVLWSGCHGAPPRPY